MFDYRKYQTLPNELIYDKTKEKKDIKSYDNDNNDNNNNNIKLSKSSPYSQLNHIKKYSDEIYNSSIYEKKN